MLKLFSGILPKSVLSDDYTGLSKSKNNTVFIGFLGSSIGILSILIALFLPISIYFKMLMILPAISVPLLLTFWIKWYLSTYIKRVEKESLMKRLGQKKVNYLENIIQNSNDIIFTIDFDSFILKFNKGAEFHFGYSQEEILGKPLSQLFANPKDITAIVKKADKFGNVVNEDISMKAKGGEIRQLNLSISKMNYENININGFVVTAIDITEKKILELELHTKNEQLGLLAITDSLTDLYNVRHFYNQIKGELKRHGRSPERKLSLILIDIDRFKELNDTEGHQMGDHVLASLAQVIKVCVRQDVDSGYRYGGDEFVIILPDTDKKQAKVVAQRIQRQFGAFKFGMTSLSIGITEAHINDNEETIVKRADDAMYSSKRSGGRGISFH